ncbi:MAG TPA: ABC transporter permease [Vicinamibacterales bacterium]|jgi:NitT/TauT family transport system permease protein
MRGTFYQRNERLILGGAAVLVALAAWQVAWSANLISPLFFTGPSAVLARFVAEWTQGNLKPDLAYSARNFVVGVALAIGVGVVLGVLIGWYRRFAILVDPFVTALYSTPRVALVPLIVIWFGLGWRSKMFVVFINAVFPVLINTIGGVRAIDVDLLRAARAYCASDWLIFKTVVVPGSVPFILTGVRQAVSLGLIGVVVGEMFGGSEGIGFMVSYGGNNFQTDTVFLGVSIIALSGIALTWLAEQLEKRFSRWRPER